MAAIAVTTAATDNDSAPGHWGDQARCRVPSAAADGDLQEFAVAAYATADVGDVEGVVVDDRYTNGVDQTGARQRGLRAVRGDHDEAARGVLVSLFENQQLTAGGKREIANLGEPAREEGGRLAGYHPPDIRRAVVIRIAGKLADVKRTVRALYHGVGGGFYGGVAIRCRDPLREGHHLCQVAVVELEDIVAAVESAGGRGAVLIGDDGAVIAGRDTPQVGRPIRAIE